jgi:hypothetical protein
MAAEKVQHRVAAVVITEGVDRSWPIADDDEGMLACLQTDLEILFRARDRRTPWAYRPN